MCVQTSHSDHSQTKYLAVVWLALFFTLLVCAQTARGFSLPANFTDTVALQGLQDPDGFAFSPDGRLFISERITGKLRVASYQALTDSWALNPIPFHDFATPEDSNGNPAARRSGGLRDIAFDPDFANNGRIYAFYMHKDTLHNRVVRVEAASPGANVSNGSEVLLIDLPFNNSSSSGSHNGGALEFGNDGYLYITTGDGWEGEFAGDNVQALDTFTGKVLRIAMDGTIPLNPFDAATVGSYKAIYALGLRNPYSMSKHPDTGTLYINEARGTNKASVYVVAAQANYKHEGTGLGIATNPWANAASSPAGGELITGGAWMPDAGLGNFPADYNGRYFVAMWGSNSSSTGQINTLASDTDPSAAAFATGIGLIGANTVSVKPVITRFNPLSGELYYMLTTYTTSSAQIRRIKFTSQETVATPVITPDGGIDPVSIDVSMSTATLGAQIRYTLDNSTPSITSTLYTSPITIDTQSQVLRAKAYLEGANTSAEASAVFIIGDTTNNSPPVVDAGEDKSVFIGQNIVLDGSGTTDPDDPDGDFLTGEQWTQLAGPEVEILDATEEIAFFIPEQVGVYRFRLEVSDGIDVGSDEVVIVVTQATRVASQPQALYTFEQGSGATVFDRSENGAALNLNIDQPANITWLSGAGIEINNDVTISSGVATKIIDACKASDEITLEAWSTTADVAQSGPARIMSLSVDTTNRNFTLGQQNDRYDVRLRTTDTNLNGTPSLTVPASTVKPELTHTVYTRDVAGNAAIYINGITQVVGNVGGSLSNWNNNYQLVLANEINQASDPDDYRPWLGRLYLSAVYCTALSAAEVAQNFSAGIPPFSDANDLDGDGVENGIDNCPQDSNSLQQNFDGDAFGDVCDADKDNDGVANLLDDDQLNNAVCADADGDSCDDCARGADGLGPLSDALPSNDGPDADNDGLCNAGDTNDDNDAEPDISDNCPLIANDDQLDSNNNGVGDVCDPAELLCIVAKARNGNVMNFCL